MDNSTNTLYFGLDYEVSKFRSYSGAHSAYGEMQMVGPDILKFVPKKKSNKNLKLGFLALVHGNEVLGLPIMNTLIQALLDGFISAEYEVLLGLGNLPAAYKNKRFVQKDLNRCFGLQGTSTVEDARAREIEKYMLNEVDYLIDLHQTVETSPNPFFIFQYASQNCFTHLSLMNSKFPAVIQFEAIGDDAGLSADEYLRSLGRFGVTFELGKIGFEDDKFHAGATACWLFIEKLNEFESYAQIAELPANRINFPMLQIVDRFVAPDDDSLLNFNLTNFANIEKNQVLGFSKSGSILSPNKGVILFPKLNQAAKKGQTLFFVCRPLQIESTYELDLQL